MSFNIGSTKVGTYDQSLGNLYPTYSRNAWKIFWNYKDGGGKKVFEFDIENYLTLINFELNEKICGACSIDFSYIDFPINIDDEIIINYSGVDVYSGYVQTIPDVKGGKVKIEPYHNQYSEKLYSGSFTNKTIKEMLKIIVQEKQSETGIRWSNNFVDITDTTTYDISYNYEKCKTIFDELIKKLDDKYWGVNASKIFTVYENESSVTRTLDNCINQEFVSVSNDLDYDKIENTRYQVFIKTTDGDSERVGEVGYGSGYDPIELEQVVHIKENKFNITVPELSDSEALDFAYADLEAQQVLNTTKIKGYDISQMFPEIGKKWKIIDKLDLITNRVLNCNETTSDSNFEFSDDGTSGWYGRNGTLAIDTSTYVYDAKSIKFTNAGGLDSFFGYDFVNNVVLVSPRKVVFMMYCTQICIIDMIIYSGTADSSNLVTDGDVNITTDADVNIIVDTFSSSSYTINVENPNRWVMYELELKSNNINIIKKIQFDIGNQSQKSFYIDNFNIFGYYREEYQGNIKKVSIKIDKSQSNQADIDLDFYDKELNDDYFREKRRIDILESMGQET